MNNYLDKAFDIITYLTVAVCFIAAISFVVTSVTSTETEHIYNAARLIAMGVFLSGFYIWLKNKALESWLSNKHPQIYSGLLQEKRGQSMFINIIAKIIKGVSNAK